MPRSIHENLARRLYNTNPEIQPITTSWEKMTHAEREEYREWAWSLINYIASIPDRPTEPVPPGHIFVKGYFRPTRRKGDEADGKGAGRSDD